MCLNIQLLFNVSCLCFLYSLTCAGLVHVSEMSASRVENASEIVDVGEHVWIKVIGREVTPTFHRNLDIKTLRKDLLSVKSHNNCVLFLLDSGRKGQVIILDESCQSRNGAGLGPQ